MAKTVTPFQFPDQAADRAEFGDRVSDDARDDEPGVDGSVIADEARQLGEDRRTEAGADDAAAEGLDWAPQTPAADHLPATLPAGRSTADQYRPAQRPSGGPAEVPAGRPENVPSSQPDGTPSQPENGPSGQPEKVPTREPETDPTAPARGHADRPTERNAEGTAVTEQHRSRKVSSRRVSLPSEIAAPGRAVGTRQPGL